MPPLSVHSRSVPNAFRLLMALLLFGAAACSDSATAPADPINVSINPGTTTVGAGGSQTFSATVSGAEGGGVTWSATGGTLSGLGNSVNWTAPVTGGSYSVTATSTADPARSASAQVTVTPVAVSVSAASALLFRGEETTLTASVTGTAQTGVTWSVTCGTLSGSGPSVTYRAPGDAGPCSAQATSTLDPAATGSATLTVRPDLIVNALGDVDDGSCDLDHCSLREALAAAHAGQGEGVIRFAGSAFTTSNPVITLQSALPPVTIDLEIRAAAGNPVTLHAGAGPGNHRRVFEVDGAVTLHLAHLVLTGGRTGTGGGILARSAARLVLDTTEVVANRTEGTPSRGAGIALEPGTRLTMSGGRVAGNIAASGSGGGILARKAEVELNGVLVSGNEAQAGAGGGVLLLGEGEVRATDTRFEGNRAGAVPAEVVAGAPSGVSGPAALPPVGVRAWAAADEAPLVPVGGANGWANGAAPEGAHAAPWPPTVQPSVVPEISASSGPATTSDDPSAHWGGALYAEGGRLVLNGVDIIANEVFGPTAGGGLAVVLGAELEMTGGAISGNRAIQGAGAGIVLQLVEVSLDDVEIRENRSGQFGAGMAMLGPDVGAILRGVALEANQASGFSNAAGGGFYLAGGGTLVIEDSSVQDNVAGTFGGGGGVTSGTSSALGSLEVRRSIFAGNRSQTDGGGVGVFGKAEALFDGVLFQDNSAGRSGGAVSLTGEVEVRASTLSENHSGGSGLTGGGAFAAGAGGAGFRGSLFIENTTLFDNSSARSGGALWITADVTARSVTIVGNRAPNQGGALYAGRDVSGSMGDADFANALLAGNFRGSLASNCETSQGGVLRSSGGNLVEALDCNALFVQASDLHGAEPGTAAELASNGGPLPTLAILAASEAIGMGNAALCPATDQRGYARQGTCDIGAFEFDGIPPAARRASWQRE